MEVGQLLLKLVQISSLATLASSGRLLLSLSKQNTSKSRQHRVKKSTTKWRATWGTSAPRRAPNIPEPRGPKVTTRDAPRYGLNSFHTHLLRSFLPHGAPLSVLSLCLPLFLLGGCDTPRLGKASQISKGRALEFIISLVRAQWNSHLHKWSLSQLSQSQFFGFVFRVSRSDTVLGTLVGEKVQGAKNVGASKIADGGQPRTRGDNPRGSPRVSERLVSIQIWRLQLTRESKV